MKIVALLICILSSSSICQINDTSLFKQCGTLLKETGIEPRQIIEELIRRNLNGEFSKTNPWLDTVVLCPNGLPGWDVADLFKSEKITKVIIKADSAFVETKYLLLAHLDQDANGFVLIKDKQTRTGIYKLVKTIYGWRVCSNLKLCYSQEYAIHSFHFNQNDSLWIAKQ